MFFHSAAVADRVMRSSTTPNNIIKPFLKMVQFAALWNPSVNHQKFRMLFRDFSSAEPHFSPQLINITLLLNHERSDGVTDAFIRYDLRVCCDWSIWLIVPQTWPRRAQAVLRPSLVSSSVDRLNRLNALQAVNSTDGLTIPHTWRSDPAALEGGREGRHF